MNRDDFINMAVMGFVSYFSYKGGVKDTVSAYEAKAFWDKQQNEINELKAQLHALKEGSL
jgi:hypothetical protein